MQRQRRPHGVFQRAPVHYRQRTRQAQAHGAGIAVGRVAKARGTAAEDFRFSLQLYVDFKTDHRLVGGQDLRALSYFGHGEF